MLPYDGSRTREHRPNHRSRWYGGDTEERAKLHMSERHDPDAPERYRLDGDWFYEFNSGGFRGADAEAGADLDVFAIGDSNTLGVGVRYEQTWPSRFVEFVQGRNPERGVSLVNLSEGGASNDYIARVMLKQCGALEPSLVLAAFASPLRKEYVEEGRSKQIRPPLETDEALAYYSSYTDAGGVLNCLKNMLLLQFFCRSRGIELVMSWARHEMLEDAAFRDHPLCGPMIDQVDATCYCAAGIKDDGTLVDVARDGFHPGPRSHERFAERLFRFYAERLPGPD